MFSQFAGAGLTTKPKACECHPYVDTVDYYNRELSVQTQAILRYPFKVGIGAFNTVVIPFCVIVVEAVVDLIAKLV